MLQDDYLLASPSPGYRPSAPAGDLLLREMSHRCSNDLQLVVSLLSLQSRRVKSDEARAALADSAERVAVLARARAARAAPTLETALRQVCEALQPQAEPRSILLSLEVERPAGGLSAHQITILALVVNELATNAIKHAFAAGAHGRITIVVGRGAAGDVTVTVDDDGLPFRDSSASGESGLGLGLTRRLMASIGGSLTVPTGPAKLFHLRIPASDGKASA